MSLQIETDEGVAKAAKLVIQDTKTKKRKEGLQVSPGVKAPMQK